MKLTEAHRYREQTVSVDEAAELLHSEGHVSECLSQELASLIAGNKPDVSIEYPRFRGGILNEQG